MPRYIDADALIKEAEKESNQDGSYGYMDTASIVDLINDAPTADVVEIVWCKYCKHNSLKRMSGNTFCDLGTGLSQLYDFCSKGERREEATD